MSNVLSKILKGIELDFVPKEYAKDFIDSVLKSYKDHSQQGGGFPSATEIWYELGDIYLVSCVYQETGDPFAFRDMLNNAENEVIYDELYDNIWDQFNGFGYSGYRDEMMEDIQNILSFHQMSHIVTWSNGFSGKQYYADYHNPIIGVW